MNQKKPPRGQLELRKKRAQYAAEQRRQAARFWDRYRRVLDVKPPPRRPAGLTDE
jgi:hypothetical protein